MEKPPYAGPPMPLTSRRVVGTFSIEDRTQLGQMAHILFWIGLDFLRGFLGDLILKKTQPF